MQVVHLSLEKVSNQKNKFKYLCLSLLRTSVREENVGEPNSRFLRVEVLQNADEHSEHRLHDIDLRVNGKSVEGLGVQNLTFVILHKELSKCVNDFFCCPFPTRKTNCSLLTASISFTASTQRCILLGNQCF